ncbi:sigma-70 family RNA polymerase sigma factor [Sphingomonas sp. H39-1-10]|uniref:sigma-70 family RNA polymerase sigma factor n=1 Tax=Sphingomonas pollutisoli TaxID=3030829 RepID=UPI0023BA20FB|nr:sigma-70 family RNA polymerase sigma factor [Sphingomonas pollutisoli]MDF0490301.1 sigma-70 family RNA polymerase sigma factor [Sphingomonas pollutisoli]
MAERKKALTVFLAHRASLIRYAKEVAGDAADPEDVVQEAWLRLSGKALKQPLAEPLGYFRMIVRNIALDGRRRQRVEARIFEPDDGSHADLVPAPVPTPEAAVLASAELAATRLALEDMPEDMRMAVEMHRLDGRKLKDIAAFLNVSTTTAHKLVSEGIERCRERAGRRMKH